MGTTTTSQRPSDPCTVVIFGAAGDLTKRKLIPALYNLSTHGLFPAQSAVVGVARRPLGDAEFRTQMAAELQKYATSPVSAEVAAAFTANHHFVGGDLSDPNTYATLKARLEEIDGKFGIPGSYEGTSMAVPHVAATAALVVASRVLGPNPSPARIEHRLETTARDIGTAGYDTRYGWGLVNAGAATATLTVNCKSVGFMSRILLGERARGQHGTGTLIR